MSASLLSMVDTTFDRAVFLEVKLVLLSFRIRTDVMDGLLAGSGGACLKSASLVSEGDMGAVILDDLICTSEPLEFVDLVESDLEMAEFDSLSHSEKEPED